MSNKELEEWFYYFSYEPHNSLEIQSALNATISSNSFGGKSKLEDMIITQYKPIREKETFVSDSNVGSIFSSLSSKIS